MCVCVHVCVRVRVRACARMCVLSEVEKGSGRGGGEGKAQGGRGSYLNLIVFSLHNNLRVISVQSVRQLGARVQLSKLVKSMTHTLKKLHNDNN